MWKTRKDLHKARQSDEAKDREVMRKFWIALATLTARLIAMTAVFHAAYEKAATLVSDIFKC